MFFVLNISFGQSSILPNGYEIIHIERILVSQRSLTQDTGLYFFVYFVNNRLIVEPILVDNRETEIKIDVASGNKSWIVVKRDAVYGNRKIIEIHLRSAGEIEFN